MKITILILGLFIFNMTYSQNHFISISNKTELNIAKEKAKNEDKVLYMIITADWCPACRILKENLSELAKEEYFKENVILAITDYDKFNESDLIWEVFDSSDSARWAAPTNVYFVRDEKYPIVILGRLNKNEITTKVAELISDSLDVTPQNTSLIIIGSFGAKSNADKQKQTLIKEGFNNIDISKVGNFYRVSVLVSGSKEKVQEVHKRVKVYHKSAWISYN